MTPFPKPCGRLDHHDAHEWTRPAHLEDAARTFACVGRVLTEGGYWADWDVEDDAREEKLDRQIRDGLADWGGAA